MSSPTNVSKDLGGHLAYAPKWVRDSHLVNSPSIEKMDRGDGRTKFALLDRAARPRHPC